MSLRFVSSERRRAAAAALVLISIPVLLGMAALTVDVGVMFGTRADLQNSADAAALAAIDILAHGEDFADPLASATQNAVDMVQQNTVMVHVVAIDPSVDVIFGRAAYDSVAGTYNFTPNDLPTNAVRVIVRHNANSPNGQVPLYFAGIFGKSATDISAQAAAMFVRERYDEQDCGYVAGAGEVVLCAPVGDCGVDSDDSGAMGTDDSDSAGLGGDSGDDSDDSASDSTNCFTEDSESGPGGVDSLRTIVVDANAAPAFLSSGATLGSFACIAGDPDDSDDSAAGDSDNSGGGAVSNRVRVCHTSANNPNNTFVLTLSPGQLAGHLAHGDTLGDCPRCSTQVVVLLGCLGRRVSKTARSHAFVAGRSRSFAGRADRYVFV